MSNPAEKTPMVCRTCGIGLNLLTDLSDGTHEWTHSRSWQTYDHEPDPVPVEEAETVADGICDFCSGPGPRLRYTGERVAASGGGNIHDYGTAWAGCLACDEYIRAGDVAGLIDRVIRTSPSPARFRDPRAAREIRRSLMALHGKYVPSIYKVEPIGGPLPPPAVPGIAPTRLPKVRDRLARYWDTSAPQIMTGTFNYEGCWVPAVDTGEPGPAFGHRMFEPDTGIINTFCNRTANTLRQGALYWISAEFTMLAVAAAANLPDLNLQPEDVPAPHGFIYWDAPIAASPEHGAGFTTDITAASWRSLPDGVWVTVYSRTEQLLRSRLIPAAYARESLGWYAPLNPGGGITFGTNAAEAATSPVLATLLATWFLMAQPGVGDTVTTSAPKTLRRSYQRSGRPAPDVHVVDLRRRSPATAPADPDGTGVTRTYTVRWMVSGFWRDQPYGPGRSLRRRQYIAPYLKGPEGAPLKTGEKPPTVNVLR